MIWSRGKRTILIVGPSRKTTSLHPAFLRQADVRLLRAGDDDEGIDLARRARPSLIVGQVNGHNGNALDLCRRLKADPKTRRIPLISVVPPELVDEAERAGTDAWLRQPLVQDEYFEAIRRFVRLPVRKHPRLDVNLRVCFEMEDSTAQAFTRNISLNGAFLKTDRAVAEGARVQASFRIPGESRTIRCEAVVHRTDPNESPFNPASGFAIEFDGMSEDDRDRLEEFIDVQTRRAPVRFS